MGSRPFVSFTNYVSHAVWSWHSWAQWRALALHSECNTESLEAFIFSFYWRITQKNAQITSAVLNKISKINTFHQNLERNQRFQHPSDHLVSPFTHYLPNPQCQYIFLHGLIHMSNFPLTPILLKVLVKILC